MILLTYYLSPKWTKFSIYYAFVDPRCDKTRMPTNRCNQLWHITEKKIQKKNYIHSKRERERETTQNNEKEKQNLRPGSFRHLNFFFFAYSLKISPLALFSSFSLSLYLLPWSDPQCLFVYADLKSIFSFFFLFFLFNDTRILFLLFTIIRAMGMKITRHRIASSNENRWERERRNYKRHKGRYVQ